MRKLNLAMIVLWCVIGALIVAALVGGTLFFKNGFSFLPFFGNDSSKMELLKDTTVSADGLKKLDLAFASDECVVFLTDSNDINIKHFGQNLQQNRLVTVERIGDRVKVSTKEQNFHFGFSFVGFSFGSWREHSRVEVYLPRSFKSTMAVDMSSGTMRFEDALELSDLAVRISSGMLHTDYPIKATNTDIEISSGSVRFSDGLETEKYSIRASSGVIIVEDKLTGNGEVNVTSGSINLDGVEIKDSLSANASSGIINIGLAKDQSFKFNGKKNSGIISTYFDATKDDHSVTATVGSDPHKTLDMGVSSGTIRIRQD